MDILKRRLTITFTMQLIDIGDLVGAAYLPYDLVRIKVLLHAVNRRVQHMSGYHIGKPCGCTAIRLGTMPRVGCVCIGNYFACRSAYTQGPVRLSDAAAAYPMLRRIATLRRISVFGRDPT